MPLPDIGVEQLGHPWDYGTDVLTKKVPKGNAAKEKHPD